VRSSRGFTLLEVLVALAILGIGVGVIFSGLAQGLRLRRDAEETIRLGILAERLVGGLLARRVAPKAAEEGEEGGLHWRVEPVEAPPPRPGEVTRTSPAAPTVEIRLTVEAPSGRRWELSSLLPAPAEAPVR
jgi:prepilin-type N-terminal cleavage/methylation domain-containing protein